MTVRSASPAADASPAVGATTGTTGTVPGRAASLVVLVGNPRPASRTLAVAIRLGELVTRGLLDRGVAVSAPALVDLAGLGPELAVWGHTSAGVRAATEQVCGAAVLVVASPTFKTTYTGLLKLFLDRLPRGALAGVAALPVMTVHDPAHAQAVDRGLSPILLELGAEVPGRGLTLLESQFGEVDAASANWLDTVLPACAAGRG